MNPIWLIRMSQWVRHPPPVWKVLLVLAVIAACIGLFLVERFVGWPDWLTTNGNTRIRVN